MNSRLMIIIARSLISWFMVEKKKALNIGSLISNIGFITKFIMKLPSLVALMSSIMFNDSFGMETTLIGFVNKV